MNNRTCPSYLYPLIKTISALIVFFVMALQNTAWGAISLNLTRIIIDQNSKEANVRVMNEGNSPVLIQAWIDTGDTNISLEYIDVPFIITAPLFRLESKAAQHLRIIFTGSKDTLPNDRESVFWLNIQEVPPTTLTNKDQDYIQIAFRTRIKLFYRPQQIPFDTERLHEQLTFEIVEKNGGLALQTHNPTPIHITVLKITINSDSKQPLKTYEPEEGMVTPYNSLTIPLEKTGHTPDQGALINYIYLNDFGVPIEKQTQLINSK